MRRLSLTLHAYKQGNASPRVDAAPPMLLRMDYNPATVLRLPPISVRPPGQIADTSENLVRLRPVGALEMPILTEMRSFMIYLVFDMI